MNVRFAVAAALLGACSHSDPFTAPDLPLGPLVDAQPARLTYGTGAGRASWNDDGSRILYPFSRGTPDNDVCLGELPSTGGQRIRELCQQDERDRDSSVRYSAGSLNSRGQLIFAFTKRLAGRVTPDRGGIYVGTMDFDPMPRLVMPLHTFVPSIQRPVDAVNYIAWIDDDEAVLVGDGSPLHLTFTATSWALMPLPGVSGAFSVDAPRRRVLIGLGPRVVAINLDTGASETLATLVDAPGRLAPAVASVAFNAGTIIASIYARRAADSPLPSVFLVRIDPSGAATTLASAEGTAWADVAVSPTGTAAVASKNGAIYRLRVP